MCGLAAAVRSAEVGVLTSTTLLRASLHIKRFWRPARLQELLSELLVDANCHMLCTCCRVSLMRKNEYRSSLLETPEQVLFWERSDQGLEERDQVHEQGHAIRSTTVLQV